MEPTRAMAWTCPGCRTRHERLIPAGTSDGQLLEVTCGACGAGFDATAVVRGGPGRPSSIYGVPWLGRAPKGGEHPTPEP